MKNIFYGWRIVGVAFLCLFFFSGCGFYGFSLFVKPLQAEFGWGRSDIMAAFTLFFFVVAMVSPFIGWVVARFGARTVILAGAVTAGLGFILLGQINNLWQFYTAYALVGMGGTAMGHVPATSIVSDWFKKRRGIAIGMMSAGIGTGGFVLAPLIGSYLIPNFGWRGSYFALALFIWVLLIPLVLLVVKTRPADKGLCPASLEAHGAARTTEGSTLRMALATSSFWLIVVAFTVGGFCQVGVVQNEVLYLEDIGFAAATAATALGIVGVGSAIGKFGFGWLCERMLAKYACAIGLGMQLGGIIMLMSVRQTSPVTMIWSHAFLMGLGLGSWVPTLAMIMSSSFGLASYSVIFGTAMFPVGFGIATGPLVAEYIYDTMKSYHWAFVIFAMLYLVAIPAVLLVHRPKLLELRNT